MPFYYTNYYRRILTLFDKDVKVLHYNLRIAINSMPSEQASEIFPKLQQKNRNDKHYWYSFIIKNVTLANHSKRLQAAIDSIVEKQIPEQYEKDFKNHKRSDFNATEIFEPLSNKKFELDMGSSKYTTPPSLTIYDLLHLLYAASEIDHIRWNAYMRTEGFTPSNSKGKKEYKTHDKLKPAEDLEISDCYKDL